MTKSKRDNGANLGFEQKLWQAADKKVGPDLTAWCLEQRAWCEAESSKKDQ